MMHKCFNTARMAACLVFSLFVALALQATTAFASEAYGLPEDGTNTLTVAPIGAVEDAIATDIAGADIVVDVYQIGTAAPKEGVEAYDYTLIAPFDTLTFFDADKATTNSWIALAESSATLVTADMQHLTVAADGATALTLPDDGIYLLMPHGKDFDVAYGNSVVESLIAVGKDYRYSFSPSVIVAPMKEAPEGQPATTDGPGNWTRDISVTIKPECTPIENPPTPPSPDEPDKPSKPSGGLAKTGDMLSFMPFVAAAGISAIVLVTFIVVAMRRRRQ